MVHNPRLHHSPVMLYTPGINHLLLVCVSCFQLHHNCGQSDLNMRTILEQEKGPIQFSNWDHFVHGFVFCCSIYLELVNLKKQKV